MRKKLNKEIYESLLNGTTLKTVLNIDEYCCKICNKRHKTIEQANFCSRNTTKPFRFLIGSKIKLDDDGVAGIGAKIIDRKYIVKRTYHEPFFKVRFVAKKIFREEYYEVEKWVASYRLSD